MPPPSVEFSTPITALPGGRFIVAHADENPVRRGFFNLLNELFHDFHQALLELRQRPYPQDAYQYLVNERNIHPYVVADSMLGIVPTGDVERMRTVETALAKCEREEQRWAEAYAGDVINLLELKRYREQIAAWREPLQVEQAGLRAELNAIGQAVERVESLIAYCVQVRQRLHSVESTEKWLALEALDIRATWIPEQPHAHSGQYSSE